MQDVREAAREFLEENPWIEPHKDALLWLERLPSEQFAVGAVLLGISLKFEDWPFELLRKTLGFKPVDDEDDEPNIAAFPDIAPLAEVVIYLYLAIAPETRADIREAMYEPFIRWHDVLFYYKDKRLCAHKLGQRNIFNA